MINRVIVHLDVAHLEVAVERATDRRFKQRLVIGIFQPAGSSMRRAALGCAELARLCVGQRGLRSS
jgi:hypothetical protein